MGPFNKQMQLDSIYILCLNFIGSHSIYRALFSKVIQCPFEEVRTIITAWMLHKPTESYDAKLFDENG